MLRLSCTRLLTGTSLLMVAAAVLPAQSSTPWGALTGCWTPSGPEGVTLGRDGASAAMLCVVPLSEGRLALLRYAGDRLTDADTLAEGALPARTEAPDCTITGTVFSAQDRTRLYRLGERRCGSSATTTTGLLGLAPGGDLLDVRSVRRGDKVTAVVQRFVATTPRDEWHAVLDATARAEAEERLLAASRLTGGDILEASTVLDSTAVAAWLAERSQPFVLTANTLRELRRANVPTNVIDMMVALSNPKQFVVDKPSATVAVRTMPRDRTLAMRNTPTWGREWASAWGPWGIGGAWDPWFWGPAGWRNASRFGVWGDGWGWNRFGNGLGWGWDPWLGPWFGNGFGNGGVVVVGNGNVAPERRGRVEGGGYSSDGPSSGRAVRRGGDMGGTPTSTAWGSPTRGASGGSYGSASGGSGGGSSGGAAGVGAGGYSSGGGGGGETAKGRPPV